MLTFLACSKPLNEGTVVDKNFEPAHSETRQVAETYYLPEYKCRSVTETQYVNGKSQTVSRQQCGTESVAHTRWVPRTFHIEDKWSIELKHCDEDNKCRKQWREVTKSVFDRVEIGSYYNNGDISAPGDF